MRGYRNFRELKKELLKDPKVRAGYEALGPEFALIESVIQKRIDKKMTQGALAKKMKTKQSAISRLESGMSNPSIKFLQKVATALGGTLKIAIQ